MEAVEEDTMIMEEEEVIHPTVLETMITVDLLVIMVHMTVLHLMDMVLHHLLLMHSSNRPLHMEPQQCQDQQHILNNNSSIMIQADNNMMHEHSRLLKGITTLEDINLKNTI
jgi:hypothetical protein